MPYCNFRWARLSYTANSASVGNVFLSFLLTSGVQDVDSDIRSRVEGLKKNLSNWRKKKVDIASSLIGGQWVWAKVIKANWGGSRGRHEEAEALHSLPAPSGGRCLRAKPSTFCFGPTNPLKLGLPFWAYLLFQRTHSWKTYTCEVKPLPLLLFSLCLYWNLKRHRQNSGEDRMRL